MTRRLVYPRLPPLGGQGACRCRSACALRRLRHERTHLSYAGIRGHRNSRIFFCAAFQTPCASSEPFTQWLPLGFLAAKVREARKRRE